MHVNDSKKEVRGGGSEREREDEREKEREDEREKERDRGSERKREGTKRERTRRKGPVYSYHLSWWAVHSRE